MSAHTLKIRSRWLDRIIDETKTFELRKHDRDYQAGDVLVLTEVDERGYWYGDTPARSVRVDVLHVLDGRHALGIDDDHCILSIGQPTVIEPEVDR